MKSSKILILLFFIALTSACEKDKKTEQEVDEVDQVKPSLTLKGATNMEVIYGEITEDPGAEAVDNKDGDLSASVISNWKEKVDTKKTGTYSVDYSVSDKAGNKSTATRKVSVKLIAASYNGGYNSYTINSSGTTPVFSATVTSVFNSNQLVIYPFAGFDPSLIVDISGTFGDQLSFSQSSGSSTLIGTGTITDGGNTITLNYRITSGASIRDNQQVLTRNSE